MSWGDLTSVLSFAGVVLVALVTARGNVRTKRTERTLPPYEALSAHVSELIADQRKTRTELEALQGEVAELRRDRSRDRAWIRLAVAWMARASEWIAVHLAGSGEVFPARPADPEWM